MKFAIEAPHREYFHNNGAIEFDGLIGEPLLQELKNSVPQHTSSLRSNKSGGAEKERDLWRKIAPFKKLVYLKTLAEIAAELNEKKILRLGYDQVLTHAYPYPQKGTYSLAESSSIQGVVCGLLICLRAPLPGTVPSKLFSIKAGNGIFFLPSTPLDFAELIDRPQGEYVLIVYAESNAVYIYQEIDPLTHVFKTLGYVYGDKLSDKLNPKVLK